MTSTPDLVRLPHEAATVRGAVRWVVIGAVAVAGLVIAGMTVHWYWGVRGAVQPAAAARAALTAKPAHALVYTLKCAMQPRAAFEVVRTTRDPAAVSDAAIRRLVADGELPVTAVCSTTITLAAGSRAGG